MRLGFWDLTNAQIKHFLKWIIKHLSNFQAWEMAHTHNRTLEDELQGTKQGESIETHTSVWRAQKPNSSERLSGVQKDACVFQMGKEREKKLHWQKARRRHYEPAMSDELFRNTNRPSATWFIDCSKKCQFGGFSFGLQFAIREIQIRELRQTSVDLRPVSGVLGVLQ